jgi:hypothetical protein
MAGFMLEEFFSLLGVAGWKVLTICDQWCATVLFLAEADVRRSMRERDRMSETGRLLTIAKRKVHHRSPKLTQRCRHV